MFYGPSPPNKTVFGVYFFDHAFVLMISRLRNILKMFVLLLPFTIHLFYLTLDLKLTLLLLSSKEPCGFRRALERSI